MSDFTTRLKRELETHADDLERQAQNFRKAAATLVPTKPRRKPGRRRKAQAS